MPRRLYDVTGLPEGTPGHDSASTASQKQAMRRNTPTMPPHPSHAQGHLNYGSAPSGQVHQPPQEPCAFIDPSQLQYLANPLLQSPSWARQGQQAPSTAGSSSNGWRGVFADAGKETADVYRQSQTAAETRKGSK